MKIFVQTLCLISAVSIFAQSPSADIRVTGEHRMLSGDTPQSARQFALADAMHKAWQETVVRLQGAAEVKAVRLKPGLIEAFVAAILEMEEQPSTAPARGDGAVYRVDVLVHLDTAGMAKRFSELRKDQEAANALVEIEKQMQELHQQLEGQEGAPLALTRFRVKHLAAQVDAALAKTEESYVSNREPSAKGRVRAKQLAQEAIAMAPDLPDAHYAMGDVLMDAGEVEAAEAEYRKALSGNSGSGSGHTRLANVLRLEGELPEAIAELREALRLDPKSVSAHTDLGIILAAQSNNAEAMAEYQESLRLDPDYIDAHNNRAIALARQRQLSEAIREFREIVRVDPDSALGYYNLGIALADMDQDQESAAALREVIRINPNHYNAHYDLGELFRLEGKFDEAVKQFGEYLRLAPDTPQSQRNIRRAKDFIEKYKNR